MKNFKRIIIIFIMIAALVCGFLFFEQKRYAFCALILTAILLYLINLRFEKGVHSAVISVIIAVMSALSAISRIAFAFIPGISPMTAIICITAFSFGPQVGFLTGMLSALVSNFYFTQGPWTLFQMLCLGLIGALAGIFSHRLQNSKILLCTFGAAAGIIYSMIMDIWTVIWYNQNMELSLYIAALSAALPFTIIYAVTNAFFLIILTKPFTKKLYRIAYRYRLNLQK